MGRYSLSLEWRRMTSRKLREQEENVLEEFERLLVTRKYISRGGVEYARGALEKALGPRKAQALLDRVTSASSS